MTTPLTEFISNVKTGVARANNYTVDFAPPSVIPTDLFGGLQLKKIFMFCESTQLPGLSLSTAPIKTFGEIREMPYEKTFENINMTFYVDKEMKVKYLFDQWISNIQDPTTRTFKYYSTYTTDINIYVQDVALNSRYRVQLFECYPKSVSAVEVSYNNKEVMRCQVSMNYKYWKSTLVTSSNVTGLPSAGLLGDILSIPNQWWNNFVDFQKNLNG